MRPSTSCNASGRNTRLSDSEDTSVGRWIECRWFINPVEALQFLVEFPQLFPALIVFLCGVSQVLAENRIVIGEPVEFALKPVQV